MRAPAGKRIARIDRTRDGLVGIAEIDRTATRRRPLAAALLREFQLRPLADDGKTDIDHLHRLVGRVVGVALLVEPVERGADAAAIALLQLRDGDRHRQA